MRAQTHRKIARAVACVLGIGDGPLLEALVSGSVAPDACPERELAVRVTRGGRVRLYSRNVRHHTTANRGRIMRFIWDARRSWLRGDAVKAAYNLGWALHYVQDMCVSPVGHWESEVEAAGAPVPLGLMRAAAARARPSPSYVESVLLALGPLKGASALTNASVASACIAAAVLGPSEPPIGLVEEEEGLRGRHVKCVSAAALLALLGAAAIAAFPPASIAFFAGALASYCLDGKYRRVRRELKWFRRS